MIGGVKDGLAVQVFYEDNVSRAYDEVLRAMKDASNAPRQNKARHLAKLARYSANKAIILPEIRLRYGESTSPAFRRFITKIPKKPSGPNERPISLFSFEERVILRSMLTVLWPLLEPDIIPHVCYCTYRVDGGVHAPRGIKEAVKYVSRKRATERPYIFETDIQGFFDGIDRAKLLDLIRPKLPEPSMEPLISAALEAESIYDEVKFPIDERHLSDAGVPQGSALSPLLACCYLTPFDGRMDEDGWAMVRYVDDLVVLCASEDEVNRAKRLVEATLLDEFRLHLSPKKTHVRKPDEPLEFLGHIIYPDGRMAPSERRVKNVRHKVFSLVDQLPGKKDREVVSELTSYLRGFFRNMEHCSFTDANFRTFGELVGE
jgi:retron-type reverse transcriptase